MTEKNLHVSLGKPSARLKGCSVREEEEEKEKEVRRPIIIFYLQMYENSLQN
jgi:hypothetical protein